MKTKILRKCLMFLMLQCLVLATSQAQSLCSQAFAYAGADQIFTVPPNVYQITVKLWGGGGASGAYVFNDIGGGGGFATATLNVNPGEQYIIIVGGAGLSGAGPGAYGGGGAKDCGVGGRGGGRSAIRNAADVELITAGAGGGGGGVSQSNQTGGHGGGGLSGEPDNWLPYGGGAGTQAEGGIGGHRKPDDPNPDAGKGEAGGLFFGGTANCIDNGYNGSGGGGYYGGGSGSDYADGAGGGGSSFIPDGGTTIAASNSVPGNISDPDYADNAGYGGVKGNAGNAGRVVILWSNTFYIDADSDGYGDAGNSIQSCAQPAGYVANSADCNDNDAAINPGAAEILGDSIDNNCNGIIDEVNISTNIGDQAWEDSTFWRTVGLSVAQDADGIPDSNDVINITEGASGNLYITGDAEMKSLIIDSASSATVSFGTNTITIDDGELSAPREGSVDAEQASLVLKGNTTLNTGGKIGHLRIDDGKVGNAKITLQQDVNVNNDLVLSPPVVQLEGDKQMHVERNMKSSSEIKGTAKIAFTGSANSDISAPAGKSQGMLEVRKLTGAKVRAITPLQAEEITISGGELQLADQEITAPVSIEGGKVAGDGDIKGTVESKISSGTDYAGKQSAISPGNSPGLITIEGNLEMDSTELGFELLGTLPGTKYDQIKVIGEIKIGRGVTLQLTADSIPDFEFVIIDNDDTDPVDGRFEGLPDNGDTLSISGNLFRIYYNGGDGNDVVLKMNNPVPIIDQCPGNISVCQNNNNVEYTVLTSTIPAPVFTYSFSGATSIEAGAAGTGSGSTFNVGITNVVVTATNLYGSANCAFSVEVTNSTWYADADADGFGDANVSIQTCVPPPGYVAGNTDCDDNDATVYPGAPEICDGKDNDCNGIIDDGLPLSTYYIDVDNDGYGNINNSIQNCSQPGGYVTDSSDCDDNDATVYSSATEICDGKDNDCNGLIDDGIIQTTYYRDADGDGHGNNSNSIRDCAQPPGYVTDNTDCDDNDASISSPPEICDGIDNNCNGLVDEGLLTTTYYRDADGDGWGDHNNSVQSCSQPPGYVTHDKDCDDNDATVYPGAPEICDGKDNNCSCDPNATKDNCSSQIDEGVKPVAYFLDADGDGYGNPKLKVTVSCGQTPHSGYVTNNSDCNDNDAAIHPGAPEICDGKDNNCNGLIDEGFDTDGDGYSSCAGDCNDNDASIHPGALEICDGKDNNCDGLIDNNIVYYRDADGDGYGNISSPKKVCVQPAGYVRDSTDCKDNNANINPGKTEICGNNIDDNCNGQIDEGCSLISVSPQPASVNEGNKGSSNMTFVVSLSAPAVKNSQVNYQTVDVTATAGTDYVTKTGTLSFSIGQSSKTVVVKITGDINPEADETFNLVLSNPVNIVISQGSATGTIINDDGLAFTKQPMYNSKISNPKDSDQVSVCSRLTIPTFLQKNKIWNILGLPTLNTIILFNANGQTVFQANNYKNNNSLSNLIPGVYFYEIVLRNQEGGIEACHGKMTIVSY